MAALWHYSTAALLLSFYWKASERRSYFRLDKESWSFLQISSTVQFLTGCILSRAFIDKSFCQKVVPRKSSASVLSQICLSVKCQGVQQCPKKWKIITSSNLPKQIWKELFSILKFPFPNFVSFQCKKKVLLVEKVGRKEGGKEGRKEGRK